MVKEKRILSYFLGWLIVGFIVCFVGINNIFAASYDANNFTAQLYDNLGPTLNAVTTTKEESGSLYYYGFIGLTANSSGGAWGVSSPIPLIANHTYSMTVDPYVSGCGYTILSSYPRLGVGTSFDNAKASYQNNTYVEEKFYQAISNSKYLQYVFTPTINASYIIFPYATTSSCSSTTNQLSTIVIEDLGESGVSQDHINTSLTNQTNEINSSIQNSTDTITGEINDMEQNIIDSNKETQEVIKDQFNSCRAGNNLFNLNNWYNSLTSNNGTISLNEDSIEFIAITNSMTNIISSYNFKLKPSTTYTLSFNANIENSFEYNTWLNLGLEAIDNVSYGTLYINSNGYYTKTFTTNQNGDFYLKGYVNTNVNNNNQVKLILNNIMLNEGSSAKTYEEYGEICQNKIDDTNNKLDGIQGALTDSSAPNTSGLENSAGWLPAGPLDSVLNLPLSLFNALTTNLNKSCNPINIPLPYVNKNITLPCINTLYNQIGITSFLSWIGVIVSGLMLYTYLLKLYKWIEDRISLNETHNVDSWGGL